MVTQQEGIKDYLLSNLLVKMETGGISSFPELFTAFIFAGGSTIPNSVLLEYLKYLFEIATRKCEDDLALATLKEIWNTYHIIIIEEEAEKKKEHYHLGEASQRADDKFFEFIVYIYPTIVWKKKDRLAEKSETVMQKNKIPDVGIRVPAMGARND